MGQLTLGLDMGPNSIGWALIDEDERRIVGTGVRVFPEGVANFDTSKEISRSEARRIARGTRRQINRRQRRKQKLKSALIECGLLPPNEAELEHVLNENPYPLRAQAVEKQLPLQKLGRIFVHLAQRRGYLSNSKREAQKADSKVVLSEINVTAAQMDGQTLGQFLAQRAASFDHRVRELEDVLPDSKKDEFKEKGRVRDRHLYRPMYEEEFDAIWAKQAEFYPDIFTESLKYGTAGRQRFPARPAPRVNGQTDLQQFGIHGLIFFHRSLKPVPREVIGICELERGKRRCPIADRHAQLFRVIQEVNNLRFIDPESGEDRRLDDNQRRLLIEHLATRDRCTFDDLRKKLGFLDSVKFNLERGKRSSIKGMTTDHAIASKIGKAWHKRPAAEKDRVVRMLITEPRDDRQVAERLTAEFQFAESEIESLLSIELPAGYAKLSIDAIDRLLPHLERGLVYMDDDESNSAVHAAGYMRRDELKRRIFGELPDPARCRDARIGDIPNPVVKRALTELRKVVNAIIREYGVPGAMHVEMGRDLRTRPKPGTEGYRKYQERLAEVREREALRDEAKAELKERDIGFGAGGRNILKYLLWKEQATECLYCGKCISQAQLFSAETDIDHILPYSKCLDDSQMNKVVSHRDCNHEKGNQFPHEWLATSDPERYERMCQQAVSLMRRGLFPYPKYKRFRQKELKLDDFIARQLNDSRYIAKLAAEYLRCLFEHDHQVIGLKGQLTHELRHQWALDTVLAEMPDSPAWQAQDDLRPGEKNRGDHRHHAIDAIVVALTNRRRLHKLSRIAKEGGVRTTGEILEEPWESFRQDVVAAVKGIRVSRRVERKVAGPLHDDMPFGATAEKDIFVKRKDVDSLSLNEVAKVRDPAIRAIISDALKRAGIEFGRGKKAYPKDMKQALTGLAMPSGVPIKRVRLCVKSETMKLIRKGTPDQAYVNPMSTHHIAFFRWSEGVKEKRGVHFVTMIDAARRIRNHEPIIQRTPPTDNPSIPHDAEFLFSLSRGEHVLAQKDSTELLLTFSTAAQSTEQMWFHLHTDARKDRKPTSFSPSTLNAKKVMIDPIGRIRWAND